MTSRGTPVRRATPSPHSDQGGFTLVELLVTMLVMGIVSSTVMAVAMRAFTTTATVTNRGNVLSDGRFALDQLSKELRQAESVDATSTSSMIKFLSYQNGVSKTYVWRVTGTAIPYSLQVSRNGGSTYTTVLGELTSTSAFTYTSHGGLIDQVTISLSLGTKTSTVALSSDVQLRNAQT
jgi:prepilin-type N-terminal cleavage/methylation domain-containing protein